MRKSLNETILEKVTLGNSITDAIPNTMTDPPPPAKDNKPKKKGSKPGPDGKPTSKKKKKKSKKNKKALKGLIKELIKELKNFNG